VNFAAVASHHKDHFGSASGGRPPLQGRMGASWRFSCPSVRVQTAFARFTARRRRAYIWTQRKTSSRKRPGLDNRCGRSSMQASPASTISLRSRPTRGKKRFTQTRSAAAGKETVNQAISSAYLPVLQPTASRRRLRYHVLRLAGPTRNGAEQHASCAPRCDVERRQDARLVEERCAEKGVSMTRSSPRRPCDDELERPGRPRT